MSYFYLYDSYLQDKAYSNQLIRLETTLTDLGIQGKIGRLTLLKSVNDLVENGLRDGTDTIVAVGNDTTLSQVAEVLANYPKTTLGFVPLGQENQSLAELLGIPIGILACHVLSSRIIETLNLGKINNQFFLQSIVAQGNPTIDCENNYRLTLQKNHRIKICNLDWWGEGETKITNPKQRLLEIVLEPINEKNWWSIKKTETTSPSFLPLKKLTLTSQQPLSLIVDQHRVMKTPAQISIASEKIRLIVGKDRKF
ncbi:MAG: diacylglycerol kinase family protein [Patescibacteria group bacterium]